MVLLEVGVAVQVHVGETAAGVVKLGADGLSERPGNEAEVRARRLPKTAGEGGARLELRGLRRHPKACDDSAQGPRSGGSRRTRRCGAREGEGKERSHRRENRPYACAHLVPRSRAFNRSPPM